MKCTIHKDREALYVCKKCGKAMCEECSIAGKSTELCPSCNREKLREDYQAIQKKIKKRCLIWFSIIAVVLIVFLVLKQFAIGFGIAGIATFIVLFSLRDYNYASLKINKSLQAINYNLSVIKAEQKAKEEESKKSKK